MKSNYEEKRQFRIEAFQSLASSNEKLSIQHYNSAKRMADVIPFGQPILVGHHSEKRDRNYRSKIHNTFSKSVEAEKKADYYAERAESILNNTAISSDDPNAIDKLQDKLKGMQAAQELYKAINKIVRKVKLSETEKVTELVALGLKEQTAIELLTPGRFGGMGVPQYKLTNNNGNMKRVKDRIAYLQRISKIESSEKEIKGVKLVVSQEDNRVQMFFPDKPSEEIRSRLKSLGFHWSPSVSAWMKMISEYGIRQAEEFLKSIPEQQ